MTSAKAAPAIWSSGAKRTGRNDVCALPSGVGVPHMFMGLRHPVRDGQTGPATTILP